MPAPFKRRPRLNTGSVGRKGNKRPGVYSRKYGTCTCLLVCWHVQVYKCVWCVVSQCTCFPNSRIFHTHMMYKCMLVMRGRYCVMASPHHSLCFVYCVGLCVSVPLFCSPSQTSIRASICSACMIASAVPC